MIQFDLNQFRATFFQEAKEHLEVMEAALLRLEQEPTDPELLSTIFRAAHSIKGASSTFGIDQVGRFTHVLESVLDRLRDRHIEVTAELVEVLLRSVDVLHGLLAAEREGTDVPAATEGVLQELRQWDVAGAAHDHPVSASATLTNSIERVYRIEFKPARDIFRSGQDPTLLLRDLAALGTLEELTLNASELPAFIELDAESCYLSWTIRLKTHRPESEIHDVFLFLDQDSLVVVRPEAADVSDPLEPTSGESAGTCESPAVGDPSGSSATIMQGSNERRSGVDRRTPNAASTSTADTETVRVDRDRLDKLINQIGELVIGASMVEQEWNSLHPASDSSSLTQLGKIVRDLQEMSLSLRMVPIAATCQKMARVVRDLSKKLGKEIRFETIGEDTELDKTVVDQIGDPLLHMVRNAADHGIESPADRIAAGKPAEGRITIRAYHQGGNIYIDIEDDGRGLDRPAILRKAVERGLVAEGATLNDSETLELIFQPGFSTASQVTDISGRGVGMDVVRKNVEALQGNVSIRSETGHGSLVTIRLPLTLAILDGLLVRLGAQIYIVPLLSVIESMRPRPDEIKHVLGRGEVIPLRGEVVPVLRLYQLFHVDSEVTDASNGLLVIVEDHGRKFALLVDELLGQQQVVIKNLETNFRKIPGVAGATILGDGRVALILDIFGLSSLRAHVDVVSFVDDTTDATLTLRPDSPSDNQPAIIELSGHAVCAHEPFSGDDQ